MSNSAYYLLQTGMNLAEAAPTVDLLLGVNGADKVTVTAEIETDSHAAPRYFGLTSAGQVQMEYLLPPEYVELVNPPRPGVESDEGFYVWLVPEDRGALERLSELPPVAVSVHFQEVPTDGFDWDVLPVIGGPERAVVRWDCWWRPVPEAGLVGDSKHAGVVLSINSADVWNFTPAPGTFELSVETREGAEGERLVRWIAGQVGRELLT